jgi:hypothetical protein
LGGFSTDRDIFHELCLLYDTINDINTTVIPNRNRLILLVDPFFDNKESLEIGMKFFSWDPDTETRSISYQLIPHEIIDNKIPSNLMHSNISSKEELYLNLNDLDISNFEQEKDFEGIIEKLGNSDKILNNLKNTNGDFNKTNLNYFKLRLTSIQKFLVIIEKYLEEKIENLDKDVLNRVELIVNEFLNTLGNEKIFEAVVKEFKQNQLVNTLTNLLKLQVNITEKINEKNL